MNYATMTEKSYECFELYHFSILQMQGKSVPFQGFVNFCSKTVESPDFEERKLQLKKLKML